jgi:hypothetical protein
MSTAFAKTHGVASGLAAQDLRLDERELLGGLLTNGHLIEEVRHKVSVRHFYDPNLKQWGEILSRCTDDAIGIKDSEVSRRADRIRVRAANRRRRELLLHMGEAGADGDGLREAVAVFQREIAEIEKDEGREGTAAEFTQASQSYRDLITDDSPEPEPILGELLYPASIAALVAVEGTGKGWIELQQMLCLAQGSPFFGLPTRRVRCGLLSLEDSRRVLKDRLMRVVLETGANEEALHDNLHFICPPRFNSIFDLLEAEHRRMLTDWIHDLGLQFVAIDTMADAHSGDEKDLRPVIQAVMPICRETEAVIQFAHHEAKMISSGRSRKEESLSHRSRGDTRFPAKTRFSMHLQRKGGLVLLSFSKTNEGKKPDPIWLKQEDSGVFTLTDAPLRANEARVQRRTQMLDEIAAAGTDGILIGDLARMLKVHPTTVGRDGREYPEQLEFTGYGRSRRLRMRTGDNT